MTPSLADEIAAVRKEAKRRKRASYVYSVVETARLLRILTYVERLETALGGLLNCVYGVHGDESLRRTKTAARKALEPS